MSTDYIHMAAEKAEYQQKVAELNKLHLDYRTLESDYEEFQRAAEEETASLTKEIQRLKSSNPATLLETTQTMCEEFKDQIVQLQEENTKLTTILSGIQTQIIQFKTEQEDAVATAQEETQKVQAQNQQLEQTNNDLTTQFSQERQQLEEEHKNTVSKLIAENETLNTALTQGTANVSGEMQSQITILRTDNEELKAENNKLRQDNIATHRLYENAKSLKEHYASIQPNVIAAAPASAPVTAPSRFAILASYFKGTGGNITRNRGLRRRKRYTTRKRRRIARA